MPPRLTAAAFVAPSPMTIFLSSTVITVLLIVVVRPSTCKSPNICTRPEFAPTTAGSITKVAGPFIVPPATSKLPAIFISPVLSPCVAGSIVNSFGTFNVSPSISKSPAIVTSPVASPCAAGSITKSAGPRRYPRSSKLFILEFISVPSQLNVSPLGSPMAAL